MRLETFTMIFRVVVGRRNAAVERQAGSYEILSNVNNRRYHTTNNITSFEESKNTTGATLNDHHTFRKRALDKIDKAIACPKMNGYQHYGGR